MRAWVSATVASLRALRPRRIVEIGCGTGLLLEALAPACTSYVGVDFSATAVARLHRRVAAEPGWAHVRLREGDALTALTEVADESVDLVILNSVVQYFPDTAYLEGVLAEAVR